MSVRSICLVAGMFCLVGCGGSTDQHAGSTVNSTQTAGTQETVSKPSDQQTSPSQPPGTMQLPADAVFPAPTASSSESSDPKSSGFELPPLDAKTAGTAPTPSSQTVTAQRPVLEDSQTASVALQPGTVEQVLEFAHHAGTACVVDFWSLGCGPCLKEFPGLVALHEKYGDKLTCVSVNCDYDGRKTKPAEKYRERAEAFLNANRAHFKNFLCTTPSEEVFAKLKTVTIPMVLVIGADGELVKTFIDSGETREFSYAKDITPLVQSLLEKAPSN